MPTIRTADKRIIPHFARNGTALTQEERAAIAKRYGLCVQCERRTHTITFFNTRRTPITNKDVHKGICITCNPTSVPVEVLQEWVYRNERCRDEVDNDELMIIRKVLSEHPRQKDFKKHGNYSNPTFNEDLYQQLVTEWISSVGDQLLEEEGVTREDLKEACEIVCTKFPRGHMTGQLLKEPIVDDTPLESRGVSLVWLRCAWGWMREATGQNSPALSTRLFVKLFVEPLVASGPGSGNNNNNNNNAKEIVPLYFFVPPAHRGKPVVFLSHGWDSWLRHLLFYPPNSESTIKFIRDNYAWLDLFAIVQDPGSTRQMDEVSRIGDVVRSIGNTCLIVPGQGPIDFALLPTRRSWCCFEIACTPPDQLTARIGLHKLCFTGPTAELRKYHQSLISSIEQINCSEAETHCLAEKEAINQLLEDEMGMDKANWIVKKAILEGFVNRYSNSGSIIAPPTHYSTLQAIKIVFNMYRDANDRLLLVP